MPYVIYLLTQRNIKTTLIVLRIRPRKTDNTRNDNHSGRYRGIWDLIFCTEKQDKKLETLKYSFKDTQFK